MLNNSRDTTLGSSRGLDVFSPIEEGATVLETGLWSQYGGNKYRTGTASVNSPNTVSEQLTFTGVDSDIGLKHVYFNTNDEMLAIFEVPDMPDIHAVYDTEENEVLWTSDMFEYAGELRGPVITDNYVYTFTEDYNRDAVVLTKYEVRTGNIVSENVTSYSVNNIVQYPKDVIVTDNKVFAFREYADPYEEPVIPAKIISYDLDTLNITDVYEFDKGINTGDMGFAADDNHIYFVYLNGSTSSTEIYKFSYDGNLVNSREINYYWSDYGIFVRIKIEPNNDQFYFYPANRNEIIAFSKNTLKPVWDVERRPYWYTDTPPAVDTVYSACIAPNGLYVIGDVYTDEYTIGIAKINRSGGISWASGFPEAEEIESYGPPPLDIKATNASVYAYIIDPQAGDGIYTHHNHNTGERISKYTLTDKGPTDVPHNKFRINGPFFSSYVGTFSGTPLEKLL